MIKKNLNENDHARAKEHGFFEEVKLSSHEKKLFAAKLILPIDVVYRLLGGRK